MGLLNYFEFDGVNSLDYGVQISGDGVFDAPKRRAKKISIPGRQGDFIVDEGAFENVTLRYPAFIVAHNEAEFKEKLEAFRSAILSKTGYMRICDSYNGDEYRMAAYLEGLEVSPKLHNKAGNFDLVFDCKPQRYLKIGELPVQISNGSALVNPTAFGSSPLLMAKGYGTIDLNGQPITIENTRIGYVFLAPRSGGSEPKSTYTDDLLNTGDTITIAQGSGADINLTIKAGGSLWGFSVENNGTDASVSVVAKSRTITITVVFKALTFANGTAKTISNPFILNYFYDDHGQTRQASITFTPTIVYTPSARQFKMSAPIPSAVATHFSAGSSLSVLESISADSSISTLGDPTYIDLEIGEAYKIVNGEAVSLNNSVAIGGTLPELAPGENTITYPSTITSLEIIPRWWRV